MQTVRVLPAHWQLAGVAANGCHGKKNSHMVQSCKRHDDAPKMCRVGSVIGEVQKYPQATQLNIRFQPWHSTAPSHN